MKTRKIAGGRHATGPVSSPTMSRTTEQRNAICVFAKEEMRFPHSSSPRMPQPSDFRSRFSTIISPFIASLFWTRIAARSGQKIKSPQRTFVMER